MYTKEKDVAEIPEQQSVICVQDRYAIHVQGHHRLSSLSSLLQGTSLFISAIPGATDISLLHWDCSICLLCQRRM